LYTETVEQGGARQAEGILREVVKGAVNLQILAEGDTPVLHLVFENRSVPAALAGDGVQMLLRLILELAARREGVVLLEEPEVHQHPGAIRQGAAAILAAVRRGIQVILTTHSLELIDSLLSGGEEDLDGTAVFRLNLEEGILKSTRLSGREALVARSQIEDDLR
jgi:predicted ATPase